MLTSHLIFSSADNFFKKIAYKAPWSWHCALYWSRTKG